MTTTGPFHLRIAVFLVSFVIIAVEITLMRELALRFWEHLAWLVISIALLGFGAGGTVLVLLQGFSRVNLLSLQFFSLIGMALSFPLSLILGDTIDIDLIQMVWQPSQFWKIGALELVIGVPFLFGGMFIGLALQDNPDRVPGHYAASFLGSGFGGIMVLPALFVLPPRLLILAGALITMATALFCIRGKRSIGVWSCAGLLLLFAIWQTPHNSKISEDKDLPLMLAMPESKIINYRYGPQGLVEVVQAPAVHAAPGVALNNNETIPDQFLVTLDAQIVGSLYKSTSDEDFAFMDNTTQALPYHLYDYSHVLIGDESGNDQIGLALFHKIKEVIALTANSSLTDLKTDSTFPYAGHISGSPRVSLLTDTVRGFLRKSKRYYPLIILPATGTDFGGLRAATADSLLTLDAFRLCFSRLESNGVLSITTQIHSPPRESLRLLHMFIDILKESGREPSRHIAMIRNWATLTLVATKSVLTDTQTSDIRSFSQKRGFDLVWLPDLKPSETNRHHILDEAEYYLGAKALLEMENSQFISNYLYDITSPDDGKPFFHHFSRWWRSKDLSIQLGNRSRAYMEIGSILLIAALFQATVLAFIFIILPLFPAVGLSGGRSNQLVVIGFFSSIGFGFMLLEMGVLQRFTVYLGHPVYAVASVLSGFLVFGGVGSIISARLKDPLTRIHCSLGFAIALIGGLLLLLLDSCLTTTEGFSLPTRMTLAILLIGPLASLMGMMFPLGIKRAGRGNARLVPWAWSANGFMSVLATLCAPLLAMQWGFNTVVWSAVGCYSIAALLSLKLPSR